MVFEKNEEIWINVQENPIVFESGFVAVHLIVNENGKIFSFSQVIK